MSTFLQRLKFYGVGFGIGLIFVFFFFQNRGCSWLPANRVKNAILDRVLTLTPEMEGELQRKGLREEDVIALLDNGKVDFSKSKKSGDFKVYVLSNDQLTCHFTLPEESFVSEVRPATKAAEKQAVNGLGWGRFIRFPNDPGLVYIDCLTVLNCKLQHVSMNKSERILKALKKRGAIHLDKTDFTVRPKVEHQVLFFSPKGDSLMGKFIWYKNKLTLQALDLPFESPCESINNLN